jgi:hypothetical protein
MDLMPPFGDQESSDRMFLHDMELAGAAIRKPPVRVG